MFKDVGGSFGGMFQWTIANRWTAGSTGLLTSFILATVTLMKQWTLTLHGPSGILSTVDSGETQFVIGTEETPWSQSHIPAW